MNLYEYNFIAMSLLVAALAAGVGVIIWRGRKKP